MPKLKDTQRTRINYYVGPSQTNCQCFLCRIYLYLWFVTERLRHFSFQMWMPWGCCLCAVWMEVWTKLSFQDGKKTSKKGEKEEKNGYASKKTPGKGLETAVVLLLQYSVCFSPSSGCLLSQKLAISQGMPCSLFSRRLVVHTACQPGKSIIQRAFWSGSSSWLLEKVCCLLCLSAPRA